MDIHHPEAPVAIDRVYTKVLDEPNTPDRLKGKTLTATVEIDKAMTFSVDIPDDATANEKGYLRWYIGEFTDKLRKRVPGLLGEEHVSVEPGTTAELLQRRNSPEGT